MSVSTRQVKVEPHAATKEPNAKVMIVKSIRDRRGNDLSPARGQFKSDRSVESGGGDG